MRRNLGRMRECPRCKKLQAPARGYCRPCKREYDNAYHARTKPERGARKLQVQKERLAALAKYVAEEKTVPCTDCKKSYPHYIMDFDHLSDDKVDNVSNMVRYGYSLENLQTEIAKCEVVCSNCHRERTYQRRIFRRNP